MGVDAADRSRQLVDVKCVYNMCMLRYLLEKVSGAYSEVSAAIQHDH